MRRLTAGVALGLAILPGMVRAENPPAPAPAPAPPKPPASVVLLGPLSSTGSTSGETTFGDLIADAVRASAGSDAALVPADDIADTALPPATTPVADIVKGVRYAGDSSDKIVVFSLTGKQVRSLLARSVQAPPPFPGFLQVSGLTITYAGAAAPNRILSLSIGGVPVRDDQVYPVATSQSVADGSFGFFRTLGGVAGRDTGVLVSDALTRYLQSHLELRVALDGRIQSSQAL